MKLRLGTLALALGLALGIAGPLFADTPDEGLVKLGDEFLDGWLTRHPQLATRLGLHGWDSKLVPVTQASVASDVQWLREMRARVRAIPIGELSFERAQEHDLLMARIERERIDLEEVRSWERNPGYYLDLVAGSVLAVLERDYSSPCERVSLATRRLRQVPEVLRAARVNLKDPPRLYTEVAIAQFAGALDFYRTTIPALTVECREPLLHGDLAEADSLAVHAVQEFLEELRADVLPHSVDSFALGRDLLQHRLAATEMESAPVESLLAGGWRALDDTRAEMAKVAARIVPGGDVAAALDSLRSDAPPAGALVPFVAAQLDTIRAFLRKHAILTLPQAENLKVRETPAFQRNLNFASMDAPGRVGEARDAGVPQRHAGGLRVGPGGAARPSRVLQPRLVADRRDPRGAARPLLPVPGTPARGLAPAPGAAQHGEHRGLGALLRGDDGGAGLRRRGSAHRAGAARARAAAHRTADRGDLAPHRAHVGARRRHACSRSAATWRR
jgi:hypothetical protein